MLASSMDTSNNGSVKGIKSEPTEIANSLPSIPVDSQEDFSALVHLKMQNVCFKAIGSKFVKFQSLCKSLFNQ